MGMSTIFRSILASLTVLLAAGTLPSSAVAGDEASIRYYEAQRQARFNLIKAVQQALTDASYDPGPVDGLEGPRTASAITAYQRDKGLMVDGTIGPETLRSLGLTD